MNAGYFSLKKNSEYVSVYTSGKVDGNPWFTVFFSLNDENLTKVGLSISKKIGRAHERNFFKRKMRVIVRDNISMLPQGYNYIFILKPKVKMLNFCDLRENWIKLAQKLNKRIKN